MSKTWNNSFERLRPNADRFKTWLNDRRAIVSDTFSQWRPSLEGSPLALNLKNLEQEWNLGRIQGRFNDMQESARARIGGEVMAKTVAFARQLIGAQLLECEISAGKISYWQTNNNNPETILWIHGFGDSKDGVYNLALHLTRHYNMVAFDLPGFGDSVKDETLTYDFEHFGLWIQEFVDKTGLGPCHVIGNSLGGAMAMKLADLCPDLVQTLTLIDTAAICDPEIPSAYDDFMKGKILFQVQNRDEFDHFWTTIFHKEPLLPLFAKDWLCEQFKQNYELYGRFIRDTFKGIHTMKDLALDDLFMDKALKKMKMPVHIIWGEADKLFPYQYGQKAHAITRGSEFTLIKGVGHAPQVEAPRLTAKHIRRFIEARKPKASTL